MALSMCLEIEKTRCYVLITPNLPGLVLEIAPLPLYFKLIKSECTEKKDLCSSSRFSYTVYFPYQVRQRRGLPLPVLPLLRLRPGGGGLRPLLLGSRYE